MPDLFKDKAEDFDERDLPQQLSKGIGECIVAHVELRPDMKVMDFGAGTGLVTQRIVDRVGRVTAVDVSEAMLGKLKEKEGLRGKVDVVCQDILDAPLDDRFDLIVSAMAMHHVDDTTTLIRRFWEHLRPGGRVALADLDAEPGDFHPPDAPHVHHHGFDRGAFGAALKAQGFSDVEFVNATTVERDGRTYPVFVALAKRP